ncbi:hypothetical protein P3S67_014963 [Capsicum chacoense]
MENTNCFTLEILLSGCYFAKQEKENSQEYEIYACTRLRHISHELVLILFQQKSWAKVVTSFVLLARSLAQLLNDCVAVVG